MEVIDIGPPDAKIMIVGEAPGQEEERQGNPFVGSSGNFLKSMLNHSGIDFRSCYVTNVINTRPPNNNFAFFYENKNRRVPSQRLEQAWFALRDKIRRIRPNVVIALGNEPMRAITGRMGITNWRGSILLFDGIKVIPTYHPANVMRKYENHVVAEMDFSKARKESASPDYLEPNVDILPFPTIQEIDEWIASIDSKRVSFDIETIGTAIRRIGLGHKNSAISIPFIHFKLNELVNTVGSTMIQIPSASVSHSSYWEPQHELVVVEKLAKLFADPSIEKVGQNSISFDQPLLEKQFGFRIVNHSLDTMHAWHVLYPELPKSLNFICTAVTPFSNYWTDKVVEDDYSEGIYNGMDCIVTWHASYEIEKELKEAKLDVFYKYHIHELAFAVACGQNYGVLVDVEERDKLKDRYSKRLAEIYEEVKTIVGGDINLNSSQQVQRLLYDKMKFPVVYKDNKPTTNVIALKTLQKKYPNDKILQLILQHRKTNIMLSTFLEAELDEDNRMRTSYDISGTETGRLSSSKNKITGKGMNLQNVPIDKPQRDQEGLRQIFIAPPGCSLVKGDLKQAETLVTAKLLERTGYPQLIRMYDNPEFDIHRWFASKIFSAPEEQINKQQRDVGKLGNHSGNYVAGPRVLQDTALKDGIEGIDYKRAKEILAIRSECIPGLREWWDSVEKKLRLTRTLTTCLGRRRIFFGRLDANTLRDAVAFEPQSIVGDVCNTIFRRLWKSLDEDCHVILQVHDEVVVECPDNKVEYVKEQMRAAAIVPLMITGKPLNIPIEIKVGKNWRDCV